MKAKPNLFLVGCPRSGTTSLYHLLNSHPDIYMSPIKGPSYFGEFPNTKFPSYHKNKKKYLSLYANRKERWLGDSSHYLISDSAPSQIHKFNSKARILIVLRKPIDMAVSHYKRGLVPNTKSFENMLNIKNNEQVNSLKKHLEYEKNLKRYFDVFGKNKVKIIFFRDLKENPLKIKRDISDFLNIDEKLFGNVIRVNASTKVKNGWIKKLINMINPDFRVFIKSSFPKKYMIRAQEFIWGLSEGQDIIFDKSEIPAELVKKNNLEAKRVSKMIKTDLNYWIEK